MERQAGIVINGNPFPHELHWEIHMNPAIGFLIHTDRAGANCPVDRVNFRYLFSDILIIKVVHVPRHLHFTRGNTLFNSCSSTTSNDMDFADIGVSKSSL